MKPVKIVSLLLLSLSAGAHAALNVYEPFLVGPSPAAGEYNAAQITGQGPTILGYTGNWLNGTALGTVTTNGLSYPGLLTSGGALLQNSGGSREGRVLSAPFNAASQGTFYMSVLLQISNTTAPANYKAFELHNGGFNDGANRVLQIGQGGTSTDFNGTTNFGLRLFNNDSFRIDLGVADTSVNLFVIRFDMSATNDQDAITIYRNPITLDSEPAIPTGTRSGFNLAFDRTTLANFQTNGDTITADEIRFGASYTDVLPVPEPSSVVLGLLAAGIGFGRRRRA